MRASPRPLGWETQAGQRDRIAKRKRFAFKHFIKKHSSELSKEDMQRMWSDYYTGGLTNTTNIHPWVGDNEMKWDQGTVLKEELVTDVVFFCKHRGYVTAEYEDILIRCSEDVMAMALDFVTELFNREAHPNSDILKTWIQEVVLV